MVKEGKCKFGNDYALGLRWLRHLGFEQVSTNPVLAARAYQDETCPSSDLPGGIQKTSELQGMVLFPLKAWR